MDVAICREETSALRPLVILLVAGGLVRLGLLWLFAGQGLSIADERDYNSLAVSLVERQEFGYYPGKLASLRPPLYPAFVAGIYTVFGLENYQAVRAVQCLLSLATTLLVYRLGIELFSKQVGVCAAGFCSFYPSLLGFNQLLLTEVLFTFLFTSSCLTVVKGIKNESPGWIALSGLLIGLSALTRSVMWLFPLVLGVYLIAAWRVPWGRRLTAVLAMLLAFCLTIAPWTIRNTRLHQTFTTIDVMGGRNLMMGNYEHTPMFRAWDAISMQGEQYWFQVLSKDHPNLGRLTQGQLDKVAQKAGVQFMRDHPRLTLKRAIVKFFNFWQLERELVAGAARGNFGNVSLSVLSAMTLLVFGSYATAFLSGLVGMFMTPATPRTCHWFLILAMAFVCGLHTLVFGHSRYHLPLIPLILVYTAACATDWRQVWQKKRTWQFLSATVVCLMFTTSWIYEIAVIDLDRYRSTFNSLIGG